MQKNYCHLTVDERRTIYKLLEAGHSKTSIASIRAIVLQHLRVSAKQ